MRQLATRGTLWALAIAAVAAALAACAGGAPGRGPGPAGDASPFPKPEQLEALRRRPAPSRPRARRPDVASWSLEASLAERLGDTPRAGGGPFPARLDAAVAARAGLAVRTAEMDCVAEELGRFQLVHGASPPEALVRFLAARCGAPVAELTSRFVGAVVPPRVDDAALSELWATDVDAILAAELMGGPRSVGLWHGRNGDHALVLVASGRRMLRLDPVATVLPPERRVRLRGEVLAPAAAIEALVNRGAYGVADCAPDPELALPQFAFTCEMARDDPTAWVAVTVQPPGRILAHTVLEALFRAPGVPASAWRAPPAPAAAPEDGGSAAERFAAAVNEVRRRAGLAPLALSAPQSRIAEELAPAFFAALASPADAMLADLVMLGLLAGWEVEGIVQRGHGGAASLAGSDDVGRLLGEAIERPSSRQALLSPDVQALAVGSLDLGDGEVPSLAALFTTYDLFSASSHARGVEAVLERLGRARAARRLPPPRRLAELDDAMLRAASRVQGGHAPERVLDGLVDESAARLGRPVQGWYAEVGDLEDLVFPEEFVSPLGVDVAVAVAVRRPEGEPWARNVVLLVGTAPGTQTRPRPPAPERVASAREAGG